MNSKTRWIIFLIILPIAVYLFVIYGRSSLLRPGDEPPPFTLNDINNGQVSLADYRGSVVMVHFWATWCDLCVHELPSIIDLANKMQGSDFIVLAVNEDGRGWDAGKYARINEPRFKILRDENGMVADDYGAYSVPQTFIVGRDGRIVDVLAGAGRWNSANYVNMIKMLLGEAK